ncbi:MAG: NrpR regulatory domain-containing protein [Dehalococcoidia bacterium]|nr:NrpR regulatory domain-containing protein [Dehalococcoidia bacterium]
MGFENHDVERKTLAILKVLSSLQKPSGARIIAQCLEDQGIHLSERAVRYHLQLTDERGLTQLVGRQDGRQITEKGLSEIRAALVKDKVGLAISRIELLAFHTTFDYELGRGSVPVNVSLFQKDRFKKAIQVMRPVFERGLCASPLVAVVESGRLIGDIRVPEGQIALATVCSVVVNGTLLKAGIPMDSRFGGTLQLQGHRPLRFTEIVHYNGCSLDPSEIFIRAKMTSVRETAATGSGEILANFREIPAVCRPLADRVLEGLSRAKVGATITMGNVSEALCEVPVEPNKIGVILIGGLNPVAAAQEAGIEAENHSMCTTMDYESLVDYREVICG